MDMNNLRTFLDDLQKASMKWIVQVLGNDRSIQHDCRAKIHNATAAMMSTVATVYITAQDSLK